MTVIASELDKAQQARAVLSPRNDAYLAPYFDQLNRISDSLNQAQSLIPNVRRQMADQKIGFEKSLREARLSAQGATNTLASELFGGQSPEAPTGTLIANADEALKAALSGGSTMQPTSPSWDDKQFMELLKAVSVNQSSAPAPVAPWQTALSNTVLTGYR